MNHLKAISKRLLSNNISKRIIFSIVRLGIFIFLFATSNLANALDALAKLFSKALQDNAGASDADSKAITKPATDGSQALDAAALALGKTIADTVGATDDVNGIDVDDDQNIIFFKVTSNSSSVADVLVRVAAYLRSFSNSANVGDVAALTFGRPVSDTGTMSDAEVKFAGLGKADTMAAGDAGELLNQDYVDNPNYFLDDYVGVKRTF
jgi:hypothetical protein